MSQSIYAQRPRGWWANIQHWFLLSLDLSEALIETTKTLKSEPNGSVSFVKLWPALAGWFGWFVLAYVMDIAPTLEASTWLQTEAAERLKWLSGIGLLAWSLQFLNTVITLFPTAVQMLGSRFSQFRLPSWQVAAATAIVWDAGTNVEPVNALMNPAWDWMTNNAVGMWGVLQGGIPSIVGAAVWAVMWLLLLLASTYYFELLFVITGWYAIGLAWKSLGYWALGWLAGKSWTKNFNWTGGFADSNVRGGATTGSRPGHKGQPQQQGNRQGNRPPHAGRGQQGPRNAQRMRPSDYEDDDEYIDQEEE